jgi:hypothetical protein
MGMPREPKATVRFVDQYFAYYRDVFPEVRSFEPFTSLHLGLIAELPRKTLPAIARAVGVDDAQTLHHFLTGRPPPGRHGSSPGQLRNLYTKTDSRRSEQWCLWQCRRKKPQCQQRLRRMRQLASGLTPRPRLVGAEDHAMALLAGVVRQAHTSLATAPQLAVEGAGNLSLYPVTTNYC